MRNFNSDEFIRLVADNPTLPIMPMVDTECVQDDGHGWWSAGMGKPEIDEYYVEDERIYLKSDDFEELVEKFFNDNHGDLYGEITDEELEEFAKETVANYEWTKAIMLPIEPQ